MRKEYVTPVMECEEFVANEYVAACYLVECGDCGKTKIVSLDKDPTPNRDDDEFVQGFVEYGFWSTWIYTGFIENCPDRKRFLRTDGLIEGNILTGKPAKLKNRPNAS